MEKPNHNLNLLPFLIIVLIIGFLEPFKLNSQYIKNGSFEMHNDSIYPRGLTGTGPDNQWGYLNNQLMKCIGFCYPDSAPFIWNPVIGSKCHHDDSGRGGGWYWATLSGSPDYFHMGGLIQAQVPYVGIYPDNNQIREYRYPYGYPSLNNDDSAFVGLRVKAYKSYNSVFFNSYKEYLQSKLNISITGPKAYEVKFYVSKSRHINRSIKNIGLYFTNVFRVLPPIFSGAFWNRNLATNDQQPYNYLSNPQIFSNIALDQTADLNGHGGWQEIKEYMFVDEHEVFNYVTIGNFQSDSALWADISPLIPWDSPLNEFEFYYFIDNLSITAIDSNYTGTCICKNNINKVTITQDLSNQDSLICCYDYEIKIPKLTYGICEVSKIVIRNGETILDEIIADFHHPLNPHFNGMSPVTGTFCLDKFSQEQDITIQFYYREADDTCVLLSHCTQNMTIKCRCDCDDLKPYPYGGSNPKFQLKKVDDSENGNCCWDMVLTNPFIEETHSCELDLSNLYLHINSVPHAAYYEFSSNGFTFDPINSIPAKKIFKAPDEAVLIPGNSITIGRICSYGSPTEEVELTFTFSRNILDGVGVCDTIMKQKISCGDSIGCCNSIVLIADTIRHHTVDSISYCTTKLLLDYINTIEYCNYDDVISVTIYNNSDQIGYINHLFRLSDIYEFPIVISPLIPFKGDKELCIQVRNESTLEECTKCIWLFCDEINPSEAMNKSSKNKSHNNKDIKIVQNTDYNWVDIYFYSDNPSPCVIKLYTIGGDEVLSKTTKVKQGKNSTRLTTTDLPSGMYMLVVDMDGHILSGSISINR